MQKLLMPLRTLFDAGYAAYRDENRDRGDLWFFLHIPKTAGSSFRAELAAMFRPNYNVHAYDGSDDPFPVRRRRAVQAFIEAARTTPFRFASGHVPLELMEPIRHSSPPPKIFTMLRDPVSRVISDFRYQSTREHPDHQAFRARYPTIYAYLDAPGERDKMMRFLAPRQRATVTETVDHVLDTFAFIGSMETYDASFAVMMDLLDADRTPSAYLRRTASEDAIDVKRTDALEEHIRTSNAADVALYDRLMPFVRDAARLRGEAPPRPQEAPERGFTLWRAV
jgi:hypothetical protein